ncbi:MAG TPA: threonine--tRNA ligase [Firmicutes bacterium]|nr:threonine--tRNA ligase [Bacillota bacterium]
MKIILPDNSVREYAQPVTAQEVAVDISEGLASNAVAAKIDGELKDIRTVINNDCSLEIITKRNEQEYLSVLRHTASHIMAQAVLRLYPDCKLAIGPSIQNGFYYDFDFSQPIGMDDLPKIEEEMGRIVKEALPLERFVLSKNEALELMKDQPYKCELINDLPDGEEISFYRQGEFTDLCAGPHMKNTSSVKHYKLISIAGAYWRGNEKNKMLTRIYATAFDKKQDLEEHLKNLEEAKKRDHNVLGRQLGYFTTSDYIGQGLPILLPKGARVIQLLQRFVEDEEEKRGYLLTKTPFMAKSDLYKISGHWDHYRDGMFIMGDPEKSDTEEVFALRPMTCPFQFQAYLAKQRSYRDLPMRLAETSTLFRNEASGEMHGLIRVRQFTISEGHLACTPEQLEGEFAGCVELARFMLQTLGLYEDVSYRFSKWDENDRDKYIGTPEEWENVQNRMREILNDLKIDYTEAAGEAAFYGPKLDIQIKNVHGKEDTLITIQIDFQLAERFGMTYIDADGQKKYPYVIHRTSIGCYERTLALLIEKYAGAMPTWLAPTQVKIMNITERVDGYCRELAQRLKSLGVRVEYDDRNEKIGFKIREAQLDKVPYMLVIGDKEAQEKTCSVRSRKNGDMGSMTADEFERMLLNEIETKEK